MAAYEGVRLSVPVLRALAVELRAAANALRSVSAALREAGLDHYAERIDDQADKAKAIALRTETIRRVLVSHTDAEIRDTQPIVLDSCTWPPIPVAPAVGCDTLGV